MAELEELELEELDELEMEVLEPEELEESEPDEPAAAAAAAAATLFGRYLCIRPVRSRTNMPRIRFPVIFPMPLPYPTRELALGVIAMNPIGEGATPDTEESGMCPTYLPRLP
jgi:hypothetical protein